MSATLREPLIKVERGWEEEAARQELVDYAEVEGDDTDVRKIVNKVAIDDGSKGIEHLVARTMEQFDRHAKEANYQGIKAFSNLPKVLDGSTLRFWEQIVEYDPGYRAEEMTSYNFKDAVKRLYNKVCGHDDMRDTQLYYMQHKMKKPKEMAPNKFFFRFKEMLAISLKLSGHFQSPNDHEKKTMLFNSFPGTYQEKFQESGKKIENETMEDIVSYFQTLHEYEEKKGRFRDKRRRDGTDDDGQPRISNKKQRGRDQKNGRRSHNNNNGGNRNGNRRNNNDGTKWYNDCPLHPHGSHKWGECRMNPNSSSFQPRDGNNNRGTSRSGGGGGYSQNNNNNRSRNDGRGNNNKNGRQSSNEVHYNDRDADSRNSRRGKSTGNSRSHSDDESIASNHYMEDTGGRNAVASSIFDDE